MRKSLGRFTILLAAISVAVLAGAAIGVPEQTYSFSIVTLDGRWEVTQAKSFQLKKQPGSNVYHYTMKGLPAKAEFTGTGGLKRVLTAPVISIDAHVAAKPDGGKQDVLDHAVFTGGVKGTETQSGVSLEMASAAASVESLGVTFKTRLTGGVRIARNDPASGSVLVTGSEGTVVSAATGDSSGDIEGPVHFVMHNLKGKHPSDFVSDCDHVHFDMTSSPFTVTMTGNVRTQGELASSPLQMVSGVSARVVVRFVKVPGGYEVLDVTGDDGQAEIGDK
jgi:hypothetical protein